MKHNVQTFNVTAAQTGSSLMSLAVLSLMVPAGKFTYPFLSSLSSFSLFPLVLLAFKIAMTDETSVLVGESILSLSRGTSLVLLVIYVLYLFFQLKTHQNLYQDLIEEEEEPTLSVPVAITLYVSVVRCWFSRTR
jgi:Ca2+:H+ antiporter